MKKILFSFLSLFFAANLFCQSIPTLKGYVNDYANIITEQDEQKITSYLSDLYENNATQIAVLTVNTTDGYSIEDYSMAVAEKWQLGSSKADNGVLVTLALDEHYVRIEVGYGLEGILTDTKCGLIIRKVMIPKFQTGDYSSGLVNGIENITGLLTDNEELVSNKVLNPSKSSSGTSSVLFGLLFELAWFIFFLSLASGKKNHFLPWLVFKSSGTKTSSTSSGFSSSSSYHRPSSSFHSSTFHGGGGHFGGGGASGHW